MLIPWKLEASVMPITIMKKKERETGRCQSFYKESQFPAAEKVRKVLLCGIYI